MRIVSGIATTLVVIAVAVGAIVATSAITGDIMNLSTGTAFLTTLVYDLIGATLGLVVGTLLATVGLISTSSR